MKVTIQGNAFITLGSNELKATGIVINGFDLMETIKEVIDRYNIDESQYIAADIVSELRTKMNVTQGQESVLGKDNEILKAACEHKPDGKHYQFDDNYDRKKCKKCGEFFV